jgi:hypothetical protein
MTIPLDYAIETDDKTLMGTGGDFQSVLRYRRAQKDARVYVLFEDSNKRLVDMLFCPREEKRAKANEKLSAFKAKYV